VDRRIFLHEEVVGRSRYVHFNLTSQKTQKKGEALNQPLLQRIAYLDAQIWTRWRVRPGASFCGRGGGGVVQGRSKNTPSARHCELKRNSQSLAPRARQPSNAAESRAQRIRGGGLGGSPPLHNPSNFHTSKISSKVCEQKTQKKANH